MQLTDSDWTHVDERARDFTGREWVFERIRTFLASDARMLVIMGPPGTGKTAIAARLAQASADRLTDVPQLPVPVGTIHAAVFCQAGRVTLLDVAQDLADQLSTALSGFGDEQRSTVAGQVAVTGVQLETGTVAAGANVAGVRIDLARLGPEDAFANGVALPLRRLAGKPGAHPPILLIDLLDEAFASPVARNLPRMLADLTGARLLLTTRDDPRVLAQLGLAGALADGGAEVVDLIEDAPAGAHDVADYAAARLHGHGPDNSIGVLSRRIGEAAQGNFLYAYFIVDGLIGSDTLAGLEISAARELTLPADGVSGIYRAYLARELGDDEDRWSSRVRPILAPLAVALGDGFDTTQLSAIGSVLAGEAFPVSKARDVTRMAGQFLQGMQPDGPFRPYHRSFAEFLLDARLNPDWPIDAAETNAAIVDGLIPRDAAGTADWSAVDPYARTYMAAHAAACGRLDSLLTDPAFLVAADVDRLLPALRGATSAEAMEAAAVVQLASANLGGRTDGERVSYLELAARMRGADALADRIGTLLPDRPWSVPRARWHVPTVHVPLTGHDGSVASVAVGQVDARPIAISGGVAGTVRIWDLRALAPLGEPLVGHEWNISALAIGAIDGRPVAVSGSQDCTVRVWDLHTRTSLGEPLTGHTEGVISVAIGEVDGRPIAISGSNDNTLRVWDLRTLAPLGEPLAGHEDEVAAVAIGNVDGRPLAVSGSQDGTIRVWDLRSLKPSGEPLLGHVGQVWGVSIGQHDDGPLVVSGGSDGTVRLWDLRTLAPLGAPLTGHHGEVSSVAVGMIADRPVVVSGSNDDTVRLWDLQSLSPLGGPLTGHEDTVLSVGICEVDDRPVVVSGGDDGTVRVWDITSLPPAGGSPVGHKGAVRSIAVGGLDDRPVVISGGDDGTLRGWDLETLGSLGDPLAGHQGPVYSVAIGGIDALPVAVSGGHDRTVRVWDLRALAPLGAPLTGHTSIVSAVAIGKIDDLPVAISGGGDNTVRAWDLEGLVGLGAPLIGHEDSVHCLAICQVDGRSVAVSGARDGLIRLWDLRSLSPMGSPVRGHVGYVISIAAGLVGDRPTAVSGGLDGTVRVWDLSSLAAQGAPLTADQGPVEAVALATMADRSVAISGDAEGAVRVWDLGSWSRTLEISLPSVTGLAFWAPDRVVVSARSGLVVIRLRAGSP